MRTVLITGSNGLIGSAAVSFFAKKAQRIIGIDNNMRKHFFGDNGDTKWNEKNLKNKFKNFVSHNIDIRNFKDLKTIFKKYNSDIDLIIHAAAQPSHDWAINDPILDFEVNANGTLNLLQLTNLYSNNAVFIFTSTNKVYGDRPNTLPLVELENRWEIDPAHIFSSGIDETMNIDNTTHSLFGASKVAADIMTQEYGKYFGIKTGIFRAGCLTGPFHSGVKLHGFLSYLIKCAIHDTTYIINGYKGKQVRDNLHSYDLINMFWHFYQNPKVGEVYNVGGARHSNCSVLEAIDQIQIITGKKIKNKYKNEHRKGDHIWWISNIDKFRNHYPDWEFSYDLKKIISEITSEMLDR
tara:strand:+ start:182 stop:1237 length:1056 start_codon:yes stop_codon:yes gene_type:complete